MRSDSLSEPAAADPDLSTSSRCRDEPVGDIAGGTLRANPLYELVVLDRLSDAERARLGSVVLEDDFYGVLRARRGTNLEPRTVSQETALLFLTLGVPAPLPSYIRTRLGGATEGTIRRLILDAVLEIECSGGFVSGPRAATIVASRRSDGGRGRIADLSCAALRYAQELEGLSAPRLAHRLYTYGRRPVTPALQRRLPDSARVLEFVGITAPVTRHTLAAGWCEDPVQATEARHWSTWRPRTRRPAEAHAQRYKLYISPSIDHLAETVAMVAAVLPGARGVKAFKVGADLPGICRPDKLVVYVDSLDALQEAAGMLQARLAGAAPHGVPFTAAITHDGLLSWGSDPPAAASHAHGRPGSWRTWVTARLAEYLVAARIDGAAEIEPWQFALERLRLSGVDTDTWIPTARMWAHALESA